VQEYG